MDYRVLWLLCLLMPGWAYAASCSMLILGDSLSSGYGLASGQGWVDRLETRLRQKAPAWRVANASVSGDTTGNGLQRLPPALDRHRPQGVIIELGANDILRGTPPAFLRQNVQALVRQAKASSAWVLLLEPPVLPNYGKAYASAVGRVYEDVARSEGVIRVPCFICVVALKPGMMQADDIHPNAQAQAAMLDAVWPYLQPKLRCPAR